MVPWRCVWRYSYLPSGPESWNTDYFPANVKRALCSVSQSLYTKSWAWLFVLVSFRNYERRDFGNRADFSYNPLARF